MQFPKPAFMPPLISPARTNSDFANSEFKLERSEDSSLDTSQVTQLNRGQLIASKLTPGQERDLNFIFKAAFEEPTATNVGIVKSFLEKWKPPKDDLVYIKQSAEKVVKSYIDKPGSRAVEFSKNWSKYNEGEKAAIVSDFVNELNKSLGNSLNINIVNTPQVNNSVPRGYYDPESNTISINIHPSVGNSFGNVISTTFHEAVHGLYYNKTRGMAPHTVRDKAKSGEISTTAAYAYVNLTDLFYTRTGKGYLTQPHEELAFSGNEFVERELRKRGIPTDRSTPSSHSTIQNIRRHGL